MISQSFDHIIQILDVQIENKTVGLIWNYLKLECKTAKAHKYFKQNYFNVSEHSQRARAGLGNRFIPVLDEIFFSI